ncbi:MAG: hypothetical protein ACI4AQ_02080 [Lachnospiraceae bacterium]
MPHTSIEFENNNRISFNINLDDSLRNINTSDRMAYRDIFERGLRCAKQNVRLAASYGFKSQALITAMVDALNLLSSQGQLNGREAIYMFEDAIACVESATSELESQHRRRCTDLRERFETERFADANDIRYLEATMELEKYCAEYSSNVHDILDAYENIFKIIGTDKIWMTIIEKIISDVKDFASKAYTTFVLPDGRQFRTTGADRPADLLNRWEDIQAELKRRIEIELERERREAAERAERERREAEMRAEQERREAERRAEIERREAEERARIAAAEEAEKIRRENERLEREYNDFVVNMNIKIDKLNEERSVVVAEYEEFQKAVGGKIAEQEEEEKFLETLLASKKSITNELEKLREDRTEKAAHMATLGVLAMNDKKALKLEMDRLDMEINEKDQKLKSYTTEIETVERRVRSKDANGKSKLKAYEARIAQYEEDIASIKKEIEDKKPFHMR